MNTEETSPWLLLLHQLPPKPDYARVKIWRRLQGLGAIAVKNSVYALPGSERTREDFQWLKLEIEGLGGEATVCEARFVDGLSDAQIRALFVAARDSDYAQLAGEVREVVAELDAAAPDRDELRARTRRLRKRFDLIVAIDFFDTEGRVVVASLLERLESALQGQKRSAGSPGTYVGRLWVTRPRVGVDRMASAWLIRRHIDPAARFAFKKEAAPREPGELRFDMTGADFTHEADRCTFEVLIERFNIETPGVELLARVVHDLDFKDGKFQDEHAAGISILLNGIEASIADDESRLERSLLIFDLMSLPPQGSIR